MKIFVAYGYNDRDKWIKDLVFPIIEAFGSEVEKGETTYDGSIPESVSNKIQRSDALIAFTTRRTTQDNVVWQTHRWVIEELAAAFALKKRTVEVRETGVDGQGGLTQANQRIEYDEKTRDNCLVRIVEAIGAWHRSNLVTLQLTFDTITEEEILNLSDVGQCEYIVRIGNEESLPKLARVFSTKGSLVAFVPKTEKESLIRLRVNYGSKTWLSYYDSLDSYKIEMRLR
jgi:hypothetical protein